MKTVNSLFKRSGVAHCKVHIFWESHKIFRILHHRFDCYYTGQLYGEDFAKSMWPSQNIWTLITWDSRFMLLNSGLSHQSLKTRNKCWQMTSYTECKGLFWNNQLHWLPKHYSSIVLNYLVAKVSHYIPLVLMIIILYLLCYSPLQFVLSTSNKKNVEGEGCWGTLWKISPTFYISLLEVWEDLKTWY